MICTLGHSSRPIEEFLALLAQPGVDLVVDVRRFPGSRRYPQYGAEALAASLGERGVAYRHEAALGGRRAPLADSPNTYWKNAMFRGYADHLGSAEAREALQRVADEARSHTLALLCAEAVPWRCHRQLIADALVARGLEVTHLLAAGRVQPHVLNPAARLEEDGVLTYPGSA